MTLKVSTKGYGLMVLIWTQTMVDIMIIFNYSFKKKDTRKVMIYKPRNCLKLFGDIEMLQ